MAYESKLDAELELALEFYQSLSGSVFELNTGTIDADNWEVIVKHHGDIQIIAKTVGARVEILNENFAAVTISPDKIMEFIIFFEIEYVSLPKSMFYIIRESYGKACLTNIHSAFPYNLKGDGVLVGIIDSGITYTHPDFRSNDGSTRIEYFWDQTIQGSPPSGFALGTEYTKSDINEALNQNTAEETYESLPSIDYIGHGTAVAGVACGNGRASGGTEVGVAPNSSLVVAKIGRGIVDEFPRNLEVMKAIKYVIDKAIQLDKPIAINIGFGMVQDGHDGRSILEIYIDQMLLRWQCNIIVGSGNQGNLAIHTSGVLEELEAIEIQIVIGTKERFYALSLWKSFIDVFDIRITAPNGKTSGRISSNPANQSYVIGNTIVFINFSEPSTINKDEEIYVHIEPSIGFLDSGIWTLTIYGVDITDGRYNIWGPTTETTIGESRFLSPNSETTLTIPSTGYSSLSVAAFNPVTNQIAAFSGRGPTRDNKIKPDLAAPGVNIISTNNEGDYSSFTGTSISSAFVTGGAAILMEWGVVKENDRFLYGDRLIAVLLKNTRRLARNIIYPNAQWGYGAFCLEDTVAYLIRQK